MIGVVSLIGAITGIASLICIAYGFGATVGKIKTDLTWLKEDVRWMRDKMFEPSIRGASSRNYISRASDRYRITEEGEKILPDNLKKEIQKIVSTEEFKKFIKINESVKNITPFIANRIDVRGVAEELDIEVPTVSFIAGAYAIKSWKER